MLQNVKKIKGATHKNKLKTLSVNKTLAVFRVPDDSLSVNFPIFNTNVPWISHTGLRDSSTLQLLHCYSVNLLGDNRNLNLLILNIHLSLTSLTLVNIYNIRVATFLINIKLAYIC